MNKINNNRVKNIISLYYLVNERFILFITSIESVKHFHVKEKYTINKNIKKNEKYSNVRHKNI